MAKKKAKNLLDDSDMLTVPEAAEFKGVSESRVYQWISEKRLTKHTDPRFGRTMVDRAELAALEHLPRGYPKGKPRKVSS